jgi:hypothetical protein
MVFHLAGTRIYLGLHRQKNISIVVGLIHQQEKNLVIDNDRVR